MVCLHFCFVFVTNILVRLFCGSLLLEYKHSFLLCIIQKLLVFQIGCFQSMLLLRMYEFQSINDLDTFRHFNFKHSIGMQWYFIVITLYLPNIIEYNFHKFIAILIRNLYFKKWMNCCFWLICESSLCILDVNLVNICSYIL